MCCYKTNNLTLGIKIKVAEKRRPQFVGWPTILKIRSDLILFHSLTESRQEAIRDAKSLLDHEICQAKSKSELVNNLNKIFRNALSCQDFGRNDYERSYYLVLCEQIEYHVTMISEGRLDLAPNHEHLQQEFHISQ